MSSRSRRQVRSRSSRTRWFGGPWTLSPIPMVRGNAHGRRSECGHAPMVSRAGTDRRSWWVSAMAPRHTLRGQSLSLYGCTRVRGYPESAPDPGSGVRPSPHSTLAATTIVTPCAKRDRDFARDRRVTVWASDGVCCPANLVLFAAEAHRRGRTVSNTRHVRNMLGLLRFVSWISRHLASYRGYPVLRASIAHPHRWGRGPA